MNPLEPSTSVVIEACAGSGKTWLLVSRIVRILLSGAQFSEILAITFTRKAAREMQNRLRDWLRLMAFAPEYEMRAFLRERFLSDEEIDSLLPKARNLFEASLATPMAITTFHGWFLEILRRAPLSSNLAGATLAESVSPLMEEAWQRFAEGLQSDAKNPAATHLMTLFAEYGLYNTRKLLTGFLEKRAEWWAYTLGKKDPAGFALERLRIELDVDPDEDIHGKFRSDSVLIGLLAEYAVLLGMNTDGDKAFALELGAALSSGRIEFEAVWQVFFTGAGGLRVRKESAAQEKRLGSAGQARFIGLHREIGSRLEAVRNALVHLKIYRFNEAGLHAGHALLGYYQELKEELGVIDFTDVEWRTHTLLNHSEHAEYMQYKLDSRYRHILLDEFQDTNPFQWQILKSWFAASNEAGLRPSVFMVGDPKQSIYRFRGAEARLFDVASGFLQQEYGAIRLSQNLSRRSSPVVIDCVNRVFPDFARHEAAQRDLPGRVEVLPLFDPERIDVEASPAFRNPLKERRIEAPDRKLEMEANAFAQKIREIVGRYPVRNPDGTSRAARYGDIMVLVRTRAGLDVYEKALKGLAIPYVGSNRGGLLGTLEALDITALLSFLIAPFADLYLAQVLKSPIFGCSDEDLASLAAIRDGSWWQRLRQAGRDSRLGEACMLLDSWMEKTGTLPVHDLLDRIYFEGDILNRYRDAVPESMKASVVANLQAFLELALEVDSGRYPSLPKFMAELAIMRSSEEAPDEGILGEAGNAVRFHTIHGAKGLESPIVWLLGANGSGDAREDSYSVICDWPPDRESPSHFSLHAVKEEKGYGRMAYFESEARHAEREDANLLYVAMTRAAQALFVSGSPGRASRSWYRRIADAAVEPENHVPVEAARAVEEAAQAGDFAWLKVPFPAGSREPSTPEMRYGIRLHAILQNGLSGDEEEGLANDARSILESPQLARFFDPACYVSAKNEASYVSEKGEVRRMDRLVEFENEIWILDYKTGDARESHREQLEEYRTAMQSVFSKPIRCALIFTDGSLQEV